MASIHSFRLSHTFPTSLSPPHHHHHHLLLQPQPPTTTTTRATDPSNEETSATTSPPPPPSEGAFENRLSQIRLKYRSGTGKKAELRKAKKSSSSPTKKTKGGVFLPPVALKEPVSSDGLKVDLGFSPYSERLNGRLAALGLAALLLVELGSGKSLLKYHNPPTLFLQVYTVASLGAVFVKFEKEKVSVWPSQK
ncbi:hypothetical protein QJS04_geneDACA024124 [Acorus gramineus]|uniref:Uncharacterized protein n=1 Tax=Acorus gramineus TaxID=55184 RepID=A0AAV8ZZJ3_ACOGR|nr:hypothetical protein QJS04_geneDACA024124 [Acorus gramineus]